MSSLSEFFKNLFTVSDEEEEEEESAVNTQEETKKPISLPEVTHSSHSPTRSTKTSLRKKHSSELSTFNDEYQIDCITIPREDKDAVQLAKLTIDKLHNGHAVIASSNEIIRDGKYYHMIFGACYALECKIEKINPYSFIFVPKNFNINNLNMKNLASKLSSASFLDEDIPT